MIHVYLPPKEWKKLEDYTHSIERYTRFDANHRFAEIDNIVINPAHDVVFHCDRRKAERRAA